MGGRDHSCEGCGRGGLNDPDGKCVCQRIELDLVSDPGISGGALLLGWARIIDPIQRVLAGDSVEDAAKDFGIPPNKLEPFVELAREILDPGDDEWDGERCQECGQPYAYVWWCFDDKLWTAVTGKEKFKNEPAPGLLCIPCFDRLAREKCVWIEWAPLNLRHLTFEPKASPRG